MRRAVASSGAGIAPPPGPARPDSVPRRPPLWEERAANHLFMALSPRLQRGKPQEPPAQLEPFTRFEIERSRARGRLAATWYPAAGEARGAVLLVPPWVPQGQAYFHRRGRIEALRAAGYHSLSFDLGGMGSSGPRPPGFYDADLEDALNALAMRAHGLPLHLWGVSAGGYWSHLLLSRRDGVSGAVFEDVACHLVRWARRMAPRGLPGYLVFQYGFRRAYRYLDLRHHAPRLRLRAAAYVGGARDRGARAEETRELARRAGAELLLVPGAGHLEAIKRAGDAVVGLALATLERAERGDGLRGSS